MCLIYLLSDFYLMVHGVESIPEFAEKYQNNVYVLLYALGVMAISILLGVKAMETLLFGYGKKINEEQ